MRCAVTNTTNPISSRFNKLTHRETKELLAPRLRELEEAESNAVAPDPATNIEFHSRATIDSDKQVPSMAGSIAAAMLAPAVGLLSLGVINVLVPVVDGLGLRWLFYENGLSNLTIVLTVGAWLLSWVLLYEAWHDRMVSRTKVYGVAFGAFVVAMVLLSPFVTRMIET
jgi:hypothetical protein